MSYEFPQDPKALSAEELAQHIDEATNAFNEFTQDPNFSVDNIPAAQAMTEGIETLRAEEADRVTQAEAAQAELQALSARVNSNTTEAEAEVEEVEEEVSAEVEVAASASPRITLAMARQHAPRQPLPAVPAVKGLELVASTDMPGMALGESMTMDQLVDGITRRASALATAKGGQSLVAAYQIPFDDNLIVKDPNNPGEGSAAVLAAVDKSRLKVSGDLVASGGWCAPSETVYDIADMACADMLWDAPEIQLSRGGLRFFQTPFLDVNALTWEWTEAQDIAAATPGGPTKPCFRVPCPAPIDVRCEAIGTCIQAGILTQRHFPELVSWYTRNAMVAHEIRIRTAMYAQALAAATPVVMGATFAAFSAVFSAVALEAADMIERLNLCESIGVEVTFPWWAKNMFLADIARQQGRPISELDPRLIETAFAQVGVAVQWARGTNLATPGDGIGNATPATVWPATLEFLIYPTGTYQIGRGAEVNLGVIYDSTLLATNDADFLWTEECVALLTRNPYARRVTLNVCPNGQVGPQPTEFACPIA